MTDDQIRKYSKKGDKENIRKDSPVLIGLTTLTEDHIGAEVYYVPRYARTHGAVTNPYHKDIERGKITHWNSHGVFVIYEGDLTPKSTYPRDLILKE